MDHEMLTLWSGLLCYVLAGSLAIVALIFQRGFHRAILLLLVLGLCLHAVSIGLRWERLGHGPFNNMFEILSSNIWSLLFVFTLTYWRIPAIRPIAAIVLPITYIMMAWIVMIPATDTRLPPTYDTIWLYVHIGFGKIFLGAMLVALGLAATVLLRHFNVGAGALIRLPGDKSLDELSYRFVLLALIFDTLMLVSGAIWAQDAWGRYWAWDPLETWAFISWALLALAIHVRLTYKPQPWVSAINTTVVFIISFMTFFGIPFISQLPHKGAV